MLVPCTFYVEYHLLRADGVCVSEKIRWESLPICCTAVFTIRGQELQKKMCLLPPSSSF